MKDKDIVHFTGDAYAVAMVSNATVNLNTTFVNNCNVIGSYNGPIPNSLAYLARNTLKE